MADLALQAPADAAPPVDGASAVAILLMLLEEDLAADVLGALGPADIKRVGAAMFRSASATEAEVAAALEKFATSMRDVPSLAVEAEPRIRKVISRAVGTDLAGNVLEAIAPPPVSAALERLRWMSAETVQQILAQEHPQVAALALAALTPEMAAAALDILSPERQAELLRRTANLSTVNEAALADLEALLPAYERRSDGAPAMKFGGTSDVAKVFNSMPKLAGERALKVMKRRDKILGQAIEDEMFIFEDLNRMDVKTLGTILRAADSNAVILALKGASSELFEKAISSMSARAAQNIRDEMAEMPLAKRADVEEAQKSIVMIAKQMASSGEIAIGDQGDDYV